MARVTVVGGGVIGLTSALGLARAGHVVRCVRDEPVADTTSAVAGGLWFPYHVEPRDRVLEWGRVALDRFTALARDPQAGVALREGVIVERRAADRWWTEALPTWREARPDELPSGATGGVVATVPLVAMPVFLPWLETRCLEAGVELVEGYVDRPRRRARRRRRGRGGAALGRARRRPRGDAVARPGRAPRQPGLTRWVVDDEHPDGMTYALPHPGWVVCGGTDVGGSWDTEPDPQVHEEILRRVREVVPELAGAQVLGARVGLRPVAPEVRLAASERRWAPGGDLLRARRRRGHPVVGLRRRGRPPRRRGDHVGRTDDTNGQVARADVRGEAAGTGCVSSARRAPVLR